MIIKMMVAFAIIFLGLPQNSYAETKSFTASFIVRAPISVTEVTPLTLGILAQPTVSDAQFNLTSEGTTSSDLNEGFISGHQSGQFHFNGESNSTLIISGTTGNCDSTNINFNDVHLSSNEMVLSNEGLGVLDVGLNISLATGITPAAYNCAYTIEFQYQ